MVDPRQPVDPWFAATWEGAALSTLLAGAQLSLKEKLAWLEDMGRFYRAVGGDEPVREGRRASPIDKDS